MKDTPQTEITIKHPSWKHALDQMRGRGLSYGATFTNVELGEWLRCEPDSITFNFAMIEIRRRIEGENGYYLARIENGKSWKIVEADAHEDVALRFDARVRSYATRSVNIRNATLANPMATLTDGQRSQMERNLEHASKRLALLFRGRAATKALPA